MGRPGSHEGRKLTVVMTQPAIFEQLPSMAD
jgi:hypothetical protein